MEYPKVKRESSLQYIHVPVPSNGGAFPALRRVAEPILRGFIELEVNLRWREGTRRGAAEVPVAAFEEARVDEYSDGSRAEGPTPGAAVTAAATRAGGGGYLGRYETVMDVEEAGIVLAWERERA